MDYQENKIEIIPYSEKSFALRGKRTKEFKERFMEEGGVYNYNLTDPVTKERFPGWAFGMKHFEKIKKLVDQINETPVVKTFYKHDLVQQTQQTNNVLDSEVQLNSCIKSPMDFAYTQIYKTQDSLTPTLETPTSVKSQDITFSTVCPEVGLKVNISYTNRKLKGVVIQVKEVEGLVTGATVKLDSFDSKGTIPSTVQLGLVGTSWKVLGTVLDSEVNFYI